MKPDTYAQLVANLAACTVLYFEPHPLPTVEAERQYTLLTLAELVNAGVLP